jgi:hypothetical protein
MRERKLRAETRVVAATAINHKKTQKIYFFVPMSPKARNVVCMCARACVRVCVDKDLMEQDVFLLAMANYLPLASVSATSCKK